MLKVKTIIDASDEYDLIRIEKVKRSLGGFITICFLPI